MSSGTRIVICGGGAIGAAIAYFSSRRGARPTVIERHAVAGAASGKSGGFLALDWCGGSPLDRLARRSFELHAELSAELGDPWGYRRLTTYGGYAAEDDTSRGARGRPWLADGVTITSQLGSPETTALVEPRAFRLPPSNSAHCTQCWSEHDRSDACRSGAFIDARTMSALGQKQTFRNVSMMSALPPKADIYQHGRDVRFVPKADSCSAANNRRSRADADGFLPRVGAIVSGSTLRGTQGSRLLLRLIAPT
jgi:hypothetical protein